MEALNTYGSMPVRVQIDLNSRDRNGHVRARISSVRGTVRKGDRVIAFEPDDRVAANAEVVRVDAGRGFLYLEVDWDSLDDDENGQRPSGIVHDDPSRRAHRPILLLPDQVTGSPTEKNARVLGEATRRVIIEVSEENPRWGAKQVHAELRLRRHDISLQMVNAVLQSRQSSRRHVG
jgi:hypothetical protein